MPGDVWVMDADGGDARPLTSTPVIEVQCDHCGARKAIAFVHREPPAAPALGRRDTRPVGGAAGAAPPPDRGASR